MYVQVTGRGRIADDEQRTPWIRPTPVYVQVTGRGRIADDEQLGPHGSDLPLCMDNSLTGALSCWGFYDEAAWLSD